MQLKGHTDEYWTERFIKGSHNALEYFYKQHYQPLCYFAIRLIEDEPEAKDIVAECFVKLWKKHADFKTAENIKAYLYISCRHVCLTYLRDLGRRTASQQLYFEQLEQDGDSILNEIINAEFFRLLDLEVKQLPEKCREVFNLIYFEDKKTDEIARQLDLSVQTVRNHKSRALELLKTAFLKKGITGPFLLAFFLFIDSL